MFKTNKSKSQPDLFATPEFTMSECDRKYMEDPLSWFNQFYVNVTCNTNEEIFRPLIAEGNMGGTNKGNPYPCSNAYAEGRSWLQ